MVSRCLKKVIVIKLCWDNDTLEFFMYPDLPINGTCILLFYPLFKGFPVTVTLMNTLLSRNKIQCKGEKYRAVLIFLTSLEVCKIAVSQPNSSFDPSMEAYLVAKQDLYGIQFIGDLESYENCPQRRCSIWPKWPICLKRTCQVKSKVLQLSP